MTPIGFSEGIVMPLLSALALAAVTVASPQTLPPAPTADPVSIVGAAAQTRGDRTPVLVLGSAHLSSLPKDFDRTRFDPLLDRLAKWAPEAIAVEGLSGPQCDYLREYAFVYTDTAETYCPDAGPARAALGLTGAQAEEEALALLDAATREPATRRRLAALFLAMGEPESAIAQWWQLPEAERYAGDGLTPDLVATIEKQSGKSSESVIIGSRLAARRGLDRVYRVDDHTGDRAGRVADEEAYGKELPEIWNSPALDERIARMNAESAALNDGSMDVVAYYRALNSPEAQRLAMATDFGAAAGSTRYPATGRAYLAYWETRNLRMVANLREVIGPGTRTLAIVGASHVAYYDRYLGMTSDVAIADTQAVLAGD